MNQLQIKNFEKQDSVDNISKWASDTDFGDLISDFDDFGEDINYKIIVELLLLLDIYHDDCIQFINQEDHLNILKELNLECTRKKKDCYITAIVNQLENIINLHNNIKQVKQTFHNVFFDKVLKPYNSNYYIMLYRGFDYKRYKTLIDSIKKLNINDEYVTNTFLSTTVLETIAVTFISKSDEIENNVLWKIRVNAENFNELKYTYLGNNIEDISDLPYIIDNRNYESEILLDFAARLKLLKKERKKMIYNYRTVNINKEYTVYEFEFMNWDEYITSSILNKVNNLKKCLLNPKGPNSVKHSVKRPHSYTSDHYMSKRRK